MEEGVFLSAANELGVPLSSEQFRQLRRFERHLRSWSARVRLVSRADRGRIWERHILESIAGLRFLPSDVLRLLDLGSGAGLPGIPLAIGRPGLQVRLLEPARMKTLFLRDAIAHLNLSRIACIRARAEDLLDCPERYDVITARAVTTLDRLWELGEPLLKPEGVLMAYKGPGSLRELQHERMGKVSVAEHVINLPLTGHRRALVLLAKA